MHIPTNLGEVFHATFGLDPELVWHAPGRANLIGEHTDYNGGLAMPFALQWGVTVAVARRAGGAVRVRSLQRDDPAGPLTLAPGEHGDGWTRFVAGVFWALRAAGHDIGGVDLLVDGDVPAGAGLSSSAALEVATACAVNDLFSLDLSDRELVEIAREAENTVAGVPCGVLDQAASVMCREGHVLFLDCGSVAGRNVPLRPADHDLALLIIDTGVRHELGDGRYARRRAECEEAARRLGVESLREVDDLPGALRSLDAVGGARVRHVVTENHRVEAALGLLRAGALGDVGPLLNASHLSLRDQFEVSCPELNVAVEAAVRGGARGARMMGGGFGGSALALVPTGNVAAVRQEVGAAYHDRGWASPRFLPAEPAAGAHRVS
ncbi:galactokinase [Sinosporangium siamense]|uniref:Galactokinase n=1 Tax=Sinosporangium siamense TaxID=1367973 RepID=A0A919RDZ6_9ACTN|nr:galactokinase [Sinosporangium siamense]GII90024.1 galactokinase [Sinosporangium siamense]